MHDTCFFFEPQWLTGACVGLAAKTVEPFLDCAGASDHDCLSIDTRQYLKKQNRKSENGRKKTKRASIS
jgi:hypothetical protein